MKKRRHRLAVPAIVMGNVRSLENKTDELASLIKTQREYRECSVLCFTETWPHSHIPDHSVAVPGFSTVRPDRDVISSGKWLCPNSGAASFKDPSFAASNGRILQRDLQAASAYCEMGQSAFRRISWLRHQMFPPLPVRHSFCSSEGCTAKPV